MSAPGRSSGRPATVTPTTTSSRSAYPARVSAHAPSVTAYGVTPAAAACAASATRSRPSTPAGRQRCRAARPARGRRRAGPPRPDHRATAAAWAPESRRAAVPTVGPPVRGGQPAQVPPEGHDRLAPPVQHLGEQDREAPPVEQQVMEGEHQVDAVRRTAEQGAHRRRGAQVEPGGALLGQQPLDVGLPVEHPHGRRMPLVDELHRLGDVVPPDGRAQRRVPAHRLPPPVGQRGHVHRPVQPVDVLLEVVRLARREQRVKEHALLHRGEGVRVDQPCRTGQRRRVDRQSANGRPSSSAGSTSAAGSATATCGVSAATVGYAKSCRVVTRSPDRWASATTRIASSEWPPRAKKSSWTPTRSTPSSSDQIRASTSPPSPPRRWYPRPPSAAASGAGSARRSSLPFGGQRQRVQPDDAAGTM